MKKFWAALGSGGAETAPFGTKAGFLDRAAVWGLPVPEGFILTEELLAAALEQNFVVREAERFRIVHPKALAERFLADLPAWKTKVAVRSAFSAEDQSQSARAGFFHSELNVSYDLKADSTPFLNALESVWSSAFRYETSFRRDVLVMKMVPAIFSGVVFSERDFPDDIVNYTGGLGDALLSGQTAGHRLELPRLFPGETKVPGFVFPSGFEGTGKRLQKLLRKLRQKFGNGNFDIEWADDGKTCYLLQIRPITRPLLRNETFTLANHKEILPALPSVFMTSLIESCAEGLFKYYRTFDPDLPERRLFIEVFYGRPLINLSLMTDMMRQWGLPSKLVTDSIGGGDDRPYGLNVRRLIRKFPVLIKMGFAQRSAVRHSEETVRKILETSSNLKGHKWSYLIDALQFVYTTLVTEMFSLTAAMSLPLALSRKLQAGQKVFADRQAVSTRLYTDLLPLREYVKSRPDIQAEIEKGLLPREPGFVKLYTAFMSKHGHRGVYESDISRPRYREQPELILQVLTQPLLPPIQSTPIGSSIWDYLLAPLWKQGADAVAAREELRYHSMHAFAAIRMALLSHAEYAVREGMLPEVSKIWDLNVLEIRRLDIGWVPDAEFWRLRAEEIAAHRAVSLPDLFRRNDDLSLFDEKLSSDVNEFKGLAITAGDVAGQAWVLDEPAFRLPKGFSPKNTILIARSIDAGWIPTFGLVAGVAVETGGDLSHGSIILRELGIPAITNVQNITRLIPQGASVRLLAEKGKIVRTG